jgi:mannose-6-phosphate isomerase-like protein (cupin superfamily)
MSLEAGVFNLYDLPPVPNICDQILREVIRLPEVSVAHVRMLPGNLARTHKHAHMTEIYVMTSGEGILYHGEGNPHGTRMKVDASYVIPPGLYHRMWNNHGGANADLEHLVFAVPPFDPADVHLMNPNEPRLFPPTQRWVTPFKGYGDPFVAQDGALIHDILGEEKKKLGIGIAIGALPPGKQPVPHSHKLCDEVYFIYSGAGDVFLDGNPYAIKAGSVVTIPHSTVHGLQNATREDLKVVCLSVPAYVDSDFHLA